MKGYCHAEQAFETEEIYQASSAGAGVRLKDGARIGGAAMNRFLGRNAASRLPLFGHALEQVRPRMEDRRLRFRYAAPLPEVRRGMWLRVAGRWHRQEAAGVHRSGACPPDQSRFIHGHCFGVYPPPGGRLALLLCLRTLWVTVSICDGPSVNAELRPWEADPLARLRRV